MGEIDSIEMPEAGLQAHKKGLEPGREEQGDVHLPANYTTVLPAARSQKRVLSGEAAGKKSRWDSLCTGSRLFDVCLCAQKLKCRKHKSSHTSSSLPHSFARANKAQHGKDQWMTCVAQLFGSCVAALLHFSLSFSRRNSLHPLQLR